MVRNLFLGCLILLSSITLASVPDVVNFTTKDYNSHSINYDFVEDSNGVMFIANAYCVLEYDGSSFRKIPLVAGKSAISLAKDHTGKIFVGSSSELGYLEKDSTQKTIYVSLKDLVPGNKEFSEVFSTVAFKDAVYFLSMYQIMRYKDGVIELVKGIGEDAFLSQMEVIGNELVYYDRKGLGRIKGLQAEIFAPLSDAYSVNSIQWSNNDYYLFGGFGIKSLQGDQNLEVSPSLKNHKITCALPIGTNQFLVGTVKEGIYLIDNKGKVLRHLTTAHGLQDNLIRKLYSDSNGNVWIAYNNGFGLIKWNSPVQYITGSQGIEGMGYSAVVYNDVLYLATYHGVYYMEDWQNGLATISPFKKFQGLPNGAVNYLTIDNGALIICQTAETYSYKYGLLKRLSNGKWYGSWIWSSADEYDKNEAFVGNYLGVSRYAYKDGNWKLMADIKGFKESSRVLEIDHNGLIWAIQGNKGLYRLQLNDTRDSAIQVTNYAELYNKPSDFFNDIFYYKDTLLITTFGGFHYLDGDSLKPHPGLQSIGHYGDRARRIDALNIYSIYQDQPHILGYDQNGWFVKNTPVSFLRSSLVGSAEFFQKIAPDVYMIGNQEGFAIYRPNGEDKIVPKNCLIRTLEVIGLGSDSLLYSGKPLEAIKLSFAQNDLRFSFTIPAFGDMDQIIYETKLARNDKEVQDWQPVKSVNFREYTNLKEGNYTFYVRAKQGNYVIGNDQYTFEILPPWYRTKTASVFYFSLVILAGIAIRRRFKAQAVKLKAEKERELEIKEKLHKAEKLEIELQNKENELAYMALSYTQKKELLASLMQKLDTLSKEMEHVERGKVSAIQRTISSNMDDESNWENFQVHFDQKNDNFFQKLKDKDPKLSESYLLFCSYVRMGKSNKEIAELLNVSVAAVEKRKYRLKKKWDLEDDQSFTDYLKSL